MVGEDEIKFPPITQNSRELKTDSGEPVFMKGKKYFFITSTAKQVKVNLKETEFDDFAWASYDGVLELVNKIYQKGKKRITINALNLLKELDLL